MKALTVCQPYAELLIRGDKPVENRTWPMHHRGPLLIHAGKSTKWLDTWREDIPGVDFGAIIGKVEVVDCCKPAELWTGHESIASNEHVEGPYCIVCANPKRLVNPIPFRGRQGLFGIPDEVLAKAVWPIDPLGVNATAAAFAKGVYR